MLWSICHCKVRTSCPLLLLGLQVIETFDVGAKLPVVVMDDDFIQYLQEQSIDSPIDINELAIYFAAWMKENCE